MPLCWFCCETAHLFSSWTVILIHFIHQIVPTEQTSSTRPPLINFLFATIGNGVANAAPYAVNKAVDMK